MSDAEGFLARWSRRKREAAAQPEAAEATPASDNTKRTSLAAAAADLPPIDSIDAASDITAFLGAGVPLDLTRAALRRAWSTDPAIRDFVGLSENAWDFNAPDGVPGFGSLNPDQIRRLVQEMFGAPEPDAPTCPAEDAVLSAASAATPVPTPEPDPPAAVAVAQTQAAPSPPVPATLRRHGSALPQ